MNKWGSEDYDDDYEVMTFDMVRVEDQDGIGFTAWDSCEHSNETPIACIDILVQKCDENDRDPVFECSVWINDDTPDPVALGSALRELLQTWFNCGGEHLGKWQHDAPLATLMEQFRKPGGE